MPTTPPCRRLRRFPIAAAPCLALAKRFEGTKYGKLAADAAEEKGK